MPTTLIRDDNEGLTVKLNMFTFKKSGVTSPEEASQCFKGQLLRINKGKNEKVLFNTKEKLIAALSKWQREAFIKTQGSGQSE